jgi:Cdc6-like AAA superfamily ATPase
LHTAIAQGGRAGGMYVSGMPGTGKTATVLNAIRQLKQLTMDKVLLILVGGVDTSIEKCTYGVL